MAAQRTLTETTSAPTADSDEDDTSTTERALLARAQLHAANVAAEYFPNLPVDVIAWDISTRAQRTARATKYDPENDESTISLTWDAYDSQGWEQFSLTVRDELIHAWQFHEFGEGDHGRTFDWWIDVLDTSRAVSDLLCHSGDLSMRKWTMLVGNRFTVAGDIVISSTDLSQFSHHINIIIQTTLIFLSTVEREYGNIDGI